MPEVLAVPLLYDAVEAQFTADSTPCLFSFGWREPASQVVGPRIVTVPGDDAGALGDVFEAKRPGRNPRALASVPEYFHVIVSGEDITAPEDERVQYSATRKLWDAWVRAAKLYAGNALQHVSTRWLIERETRRYGASLLSVWSIEAAILDEVPGVPYLSPFATVSPTDGDLDVDQGIVTENVIVDNGA